MGKWGKRKADCDDADSDGGGGGGGRSSKRPSSKSDYADYITVCELSNRRKVSVRNWQGNIMVDIRDFYTKDGKEMPGKKGISLTMDQWNILRDHIVEIDKAVANNA